MVNMQLEEVIERVTREVIQRLEQGGQEPAIEGPKILAIFTGGCAEELEQGARQIATLRQMPANITVISSEMAKNALALQQFGEITGNIVFFDEKSNIVASQFVKQFDLILIPVLTQNAAVKVANLFRDNIITDVIAEAIIAAKPILAAIDAIFSSDTMPPAYKTVLNTMLQQLKAYGITFTSLTELPNKAASMLRTSLKSKTDQSIFQGNSSQDYQSPSENQVSGQQAREKKLITARDVEEVARSGGTRIRGKNLLITPLARDRAKELSIAFDHNG